MVTCHVFSHCGHVIRSGTEDRTSEVAQESGAQVLTSSRGRAVQMNTGARATKVPQRLDENREKEKRNEEKQKMCRELKERKRMEENGREMEELGN